MKGISIHNRVFFLVLIPTLILSVLLGAYIIVSRIYDLEKELRLQGEIILSHIVNSSRHGFLKDPQKTFQNLTSLVLEEKDMESVTFYDENRNLLAYSDGDDFQTTDHLKNISFNPQKTTVVENKDTLTITAPVIVNHLNPISHVTNKKIAGWIAITMTRTKTQLKEYQVILVTLIILALSIIISILLARRTAKKLTHPLYIMRSAIKKLEQGQLSTRVHTASGGEISELEEGINKMASSLQLAQDELQNNIDQATSDLQQSLEIIEKKNIELAAAQKEALEGSRIKSEFIANMSHEIRTPMNSIIGFTNLLLETELTPLQRNYLNTIQKSTFNLLNLVNNILDFSRLDAGQLRLEYLAFDLRDYIEDIVTIMSPVANAKHLEFAALIDDDVPRKMISDPLRLKQIIINLVSNAIKFTDNGEVTLRVRVDKKTTKSIKLRIEIKDSGIGLSQHDQKFIFRAFQQADISIARKYGGTGLGLAICKKLVDQMAGQIGLDSTEGNGSTFWFTFSAENTPNDCSTEQELIDFNNIQIFLYEHHAITRESLKNLLSYWHVQVVEFTDLNELGKKLKDTVSPACIIVGSSQHEINNGIAAKNLLMLKNAFNGPILILTNSSEQSVLEYFLAEGASISLTKPVTRNTLYHAIFQLTNTQRSSTPVIVSDKDLLGLSLIGKNILCVDDNPHNANLVSALLQQTQASVFIAHDGIEALQIADRQDFDLILMDIRMPRMDGYETLKHIRNSDNLNSKTPIIALSAHISIDESTDLTHKGFNDYLTKPIARNSLLAILKKWIFQKPSTDTKQVIDWDLGIKLANNKREVAEEMLLLLIETLPLEVSEIKQAYDARHYSELLQKIHKLHGAVCYCGVPRLKEAIATLETMLKKNKYDDIDQLFYKFDFEVKELFKQSSEFIRILTLTPHSKREQLRE